MILTERLIINELQADDASTLFSYRSDKELCRFQDFMLASVEDTLSFIQEQTQLKLGVAGKWKQLAIRDLQGQLMGDCAVMFLNDEPRIAEIGITIDHSYQNQGYGREAIQSLVKHLFEKHNIHKCIAKVDIRNLPSQIMLTHAGFVKEAHFESHYWDKIDKDWFDELQYGWVNRN